MRATAILRVSAVGAGVLILLAQATSVDAQPEPVERDALSGWSAQSGASQTVGTYTGTLVCMSETTPGAKAAPCAQFGLRVEGHSKVHPLIPGTPEVEKQIQSAALRDKMVLLVGVQIPETGQIMASGVSPKQ